MQFVAQIGNRERDQREIEPVEQRDERGHQQQPDMEPSEAGALEKRRDVERALCARLLLDGHFFRDPLPAFSVRLTAIPLACYSFAGRVSPVQAALELTPIEARYRFTLRAAWRRRCSFSTSAMRT